MAATAPPVAPPAHLATAPMRNGLGIAALCCGLVGILMGFIPIMFLASGTLGILAIVFGLIGLRRAQRKEASNRGMAIAGLVTGVAALALAIWGVVIVFTGLNTLSNDLDSATSSAVPAAHTAQVVNQEDRLVHQSLFIGNS